MVARVQSRHGGCRLPPLWQLLPSSSERRLRGRERQALSGYKGASTMIELVLLALVGMSMQEKVVKKKPHIVFIMADDLGWDDVSFHGSSQIPTPNMDAMAADGIILNQHYVQPVCTPSRSSLMTGRYPYLTGMQHGVIMPAEPWAVPLKYTFMPQHLKRLGYRTHMIGKWHLGYYDSKYVPVNRGFDTFLGFYSPALDYYTQNFTFDNHTGHDFWNGDNIYWVDKEKKQYSTHYYTRKTVQLIQVHNKSTPLFLLLSHQAPHTSGGPTLLQVPKKGIRDFSYIQEENRTLFAGMVDALDQSVGSVVDALQKADMLTDTILVFCTDNGALPWGFKSNRGSNWPLRGTKFTLYEGGVRGTAFIWSPLLNNSRRVSSQLMHITDWLPTLYSAAGGNVEDLGSIDGVDMWEALRTGTESKREAVVHNINGRFNYSAIRDGDYKLIERTFRISLYDQRFETVGGKRPYDDLDTLMNNSTAANALRAFYKKKHLKYRENWRRDAKIDCGKKTSTVDIHQGIYYLFNIKEDPCETENLAKKPEEAEVLQDLKLKIECSKAREVTPLNKPADPAGFPEYHNGVWDHWVPT
ncbi:arylsulfatase B-like [Ixodes scapularis]